MATWHPLPAILFPPPPSLIVTAMTAFSFLSLLAGGVFEARGVHLRYSKFVGVGGGRKISSRAGMIVIYTPAFIAAAAAFLALLAAGPTGGFVSGERARLISSALAFHFFKRIFEVLFIHRYSGHTTLASSITISIGYLSTTLLMNHAQLLAAAADDSRRPATDLRAAGAALFVVGAAGNFYHHLLLSMLRGKKKEVGDKDDDEQQQQKGYNKYMIPRGGLFGLVACPHYLFEAVEFVGMFFMSQTVYSMSVATGTFFYLLGRSYATREWYLSRFHGSYPKHVKALVPYLF